MDRAVVDQKVESLRRCLDRVRTRLPSTVEALQNDPDSQDIVSLNLTRAVQLCIDLAAHWLAEHGDYPVPKTIGQTFDVLASGGLIDSELASRMKKAVGFRNIMVHSYDEIDWAIVHT
ncbi:type VII toxin-antitoxin system HepT family RNase toxin, partial [Saccharospirillum impatiens]|uniref:type VII toxin-antitoxin system HepT family RNase toxin n=1 Tax=Saccharospirillum impatiens TaxID=169438 RepID=UPI00048C4462